MMRLIETTCLAAVALSLAGGAAQAQGGKLNCKAPETQMEINMCARKDFEAADKQLNTVYGKAIARLKEQDTAYKDLGPSFVGAEAGLREAQRNWILDRDGLCTTAGKTTEGGSMQPMVISSCMAMMTRSRTAELKWLIEQVDPS